MIPLLECFIVVTFSSRLSLTFFPSILPPTLSPPLSTSISIAPSESKDLKQVFHKAVRKISHVLVVTQLQALDNDNVMMSHH